MFRSDSVLRAACALVLLLSATFATADETIEDELIVVGSRLAIEADAVAGAPARLDADDFREARSAFVTDLLRTIPSTALTRTGAVGGLTQMRLRGSEANHTLVLLDGFEANDPAIGSEFDFAHLRPSTIEAVEILPGPSGALWGSDAVAGAVALRTPRARGPLDWSLVGSAGERGTRETALRLGHRGERGEVNAVIDHYATDGSNIARRGDEDDGYRSTTAALHGAVDVTDALRVTAVARHLDADIEYDPTPAPSFLPADGDLETDLVRTLVGVRADLDPDGAWQHRLTLETLASDYEDSADGVVTDERRGDRRRAAWQSAVDFEAGLPGRQRLILAAEVERLGFAQRGTATAFGDPNQDQTLTHRSAVAEWRWRAPNDVVVAAMLRRDANEDFDDATHWRLGVRSPLPAGLGAAWASVAVATKNPTFTERFGFTPDTFSGNPDLEPERSRGIELGWTRGFADGRAGLELLWYRTRLEDEIDGFVFDPATGAFTADNRDRDSRREGVEAALRVRPLDGTTVEARWAWSDASEPDAGGQVRELRRPRHSGSVSATHAFSTAPVTARVDAVWTGERRDQDFAAFPARTVVLGDAVLVGAAVNWRLADAVTLFVRGDNLLDERNEEVYGYRSPGRALHAGFELRRR
jgi:vitamin B12 transporter